MKHKSLVGDSVVMRDIELEIECAARCDAKVLITGQSGVGKEVVAHLIHQRSQRSHRPLVTINCAGVPETLLESELFGHIRGSFTDAHRDKTGYLEQAHGGTIFMDEIGEMSLRMQALLLRFMENGEIQPVGSDRPSSVLNVRVIAATNRDLTARIAEKSFREDLYYRLNVIHVAIPSLRERRDDVRPLLEYFLRTLCDQHRVSQPRISESAMAKLVAYDWPGNVRELRNVVERIVLRARSDEISLPDLPREVSGQFSSVASSPKAAERPVSDVLLERMTVEGQSFWSVVYEPFMSRDLTREDLRAIIARGLEHTKGNYKLLIMLFNVPPGDYKRVLNFLRKYDCHMPFQRFRTVPAQLRSSTWTEERVGAAR
jgi:DNA-binding NtrC family response regulator